MPLSVIKVTSGGLPVSAAPTAQGGTPVLIATNGYGVAVTTVASGGLPVTDVGGTLFGPAVVPFPTLPGLAGRWNAANVTTSSGNVTSATDLSGNGHNLTPLGGNVPLNPTGWSGSLGSKPAFDFKFANNALLRATSIPMGAGQTGYAFFVGKMLAACGTYGGAVAYGVAGGNDYASAGCALFIARDSGGNVLASRADAVYGVITTSPISLATNYRCGVNVDGSGSGLASTYLNNVLQFQKSVPGSFGNNGTIVVGGRYTGGAPLPTDNPWEGPIVEVVVGNGTLSATNRNDLDAYFTAQWGT